MSSASARPSGFENLRGARVFSSFDGFLAFSVLCFLEFARSSRAGRASSNGHFEHPSEAKQASNGSDGVDFLDFFWFNVVFAICLSFLSLLVLSRCFQVFSSRPSRKPQMAPDGSEACAVLQRYINEVMGTFWTLMFRIPPETISSKKRKKWSTRISLISNQILNTLHEHM